MKFKLKCYDQQYKIGATEAVESVLLLYGRAFPLAFRSSRRRPDPAARL